MKCGVFFIIFHIKLLKIHNAIPYMDGYWCRILTPIFSAIILFLFFWVFCIKNLCSLFIQLIFGMVNPSADDDFTCGIAFIDLLFCIIISHLSKYYILIKLVCCLHLMILYFISLFFSAHRNIISNHFSRFFLGLDTTFICMA